MTRIWNSRLQFQYFYVLGLVLNVDSFITIFSLWFDNEYTSSINTCSSFFIDKIGTYYETPIFHLIFELSWHCTRCSFHFFLLMNTRDSFVIFVKLQIWLQTLPSFITIIIVDSHQSPAAMGLRPKASYQLLMVAWRRVYFSCIVPH